MGVRRPTSAESTLARRRRSRPTGRSVMAGVYGSLVGVGAFAIARYDADGSLDGSFSGDGRDTTVFDGGDAGAKAVAVQADGKIVAAGFSGGNTANVGFALARYNVDATLDSSF